MDDKDRMEEAGDCLEDTICRYLNAMGKGARQKRVDELLHWLNFERRLAALTPAQIEHMSVRELTQAQRDALAACKTEEARDILITGLARGRYFVECAWADYLNGNTASPPMGPAVAKLKGS